MAQEQDPGPEHDVPIGGSIVPGPEQLRFQQNFRQGNQLRQVH